MCRLAGGGGIHHLESDVRLQQAARERGLRKRSVAPVPSSTISGLIASRNSKCDAFKASKFGTRSLR